MVSSAGDSKWLSALMQCRNISSGYKIDHGLLNQELLNISKLLQTTPITAKIAVDLESVLEHLMKNTELDWINWNLDKDSSTALFEVFMKCPPDSALLSLLSIFAKLSTGSRQELCLLLLENYFKQGRFITLLMEKSACVGDEGPCAQTIFRNLLTALNSLPNKVANNTLGQFSNLFHHEQFFQLLSVQTGEVLEMLVENVRKEKDVSVCFISQMIELFCFCGKAGPFIGTLLPLLTAKASSDFIWRKIIQKVFAALTERHMEPTVTYTITKLPWCGCMRWFFGDSILTKKKLKFLFLHKLMLVKHFSDARILQNIIGYVADDMKTKHLVMETLQKLLSVWADSSAIKHVSYEQHKYVTQAILICFGHLTKAQIEKHKHDLTAWLAPGMSSHLDSSDQKVRRLGMIVGEVLSRKTDFKGDNRLEFGYEKDKETRFLIDLVTPNAPPKDKYYNDLLAHYQTTRDSIESKANVAHKKAVAGSIKSFSASKATFLEVISSAALQEMDAVSTEGATMQMEKEECSEEVDSDDDDDDGDDDLKPFDLSNDTVYKKVKPPTYIRDCMEGLLEREDRDKMEVCLGAVKDLIGKNPVAAKEISVELCKILLVLDDTFAIENFTVLRMSAMTELAIVDTERVVGCLTREFYEENYCLQHRLDVLDVLTAAARVLSSVEREGGGKSLEVQEDFETAHSAETWRDVVDRRIEAKTRRFGKLRKKAVPPKENHFGPIAGCFFYPLLAGYDKRIRTMDLLGTDAMVLGRLLYAVGTIVYSAINTMAASTMAKYLLEFVLEVRFHSEAYVRQAVLFCVTTATITAGKSLLGLDVTEEIIEWVNEVMARDANERTKQLAAQTAMTMKACFSKNLGAEP